MKDPTTGAVMCFEGRVLPFGATASVVHFNRISKLLHAIGFKLDLLWGSYFDDFPILSLACQADSTMETAVMLLRLLGFQFAEHKLKAFSSAAVVLGVELDLTCAGQSIVRVRNKPGRVAEIVSYTNKLLSGGSLTFSQCSKITGKLQYADGQIMGRVRRLAMTDLRDMLRCGAKTVQLTDVAIHPSVVC